MMVNLTAIRSVLAVLAVGALTCFTGHASQSKQRAISQMPVEAGRQSPVQIVSVMVKGEVVESGRQFPAGDDWLLDVTFRLKNVSDKPISFVEVNMRFPNPAGQKSKHHTISGLRYGCWPGFLCYPDARGSTKEIMPGETQDVGLTEGEYRGWMDALARLGAVVPVEAVEYDIGLVFFDSDTQWSRGFLYRRDASKPNTYRMADRYVLTTKPE